MSSSAQPLVAVFGATGHQGGSVLRSLLRSNEFRVRAITRNPQSEEAQKLLSQHKSGLEVVAGHLEDAKSLEQALTGAWGVFLVTQFLPQQGDLEEKLAKAGADAALKAGVKFFVFSSMPDAEAISKGSRPVGHFTAKNKGEQYIRSLPFADGSAFPYSGFFANNFLGLAAPRKNEKDGVYEFINVLRNDVAIPIVDTEEEFGPTVAELFRHPKKYSGESIFTGTYYTLPQWAAIFSSVIGKPARYVRLSLSAATFIPEPMKAMCGYFNDFGYYAGADVHHIVKKTDALAFWKAHVQQF